jgi:hypothetical protein
VRCKRRMAERPQSSRPSRPARHRSRPSGAADAGTAWSQIWGVKIVPWRTEYLLPRRRCAGMTTTVARPPAGGVVNGISSGPVLNTAAVALTAFGNVPTERPADLITILYGQDVSAGFVDRASTRSAAGLTEAGFDTAMLAALMAEPVLAADESPVQVVIPATDPDTGQPIPGSPHVPAIRTPDERLAWPAGLTSCIYDTVIAALRTSAGHSIVDGYGAHQRLRTGIDAVLAGVQQCVQHVMRRCRGVAELGPGTLQSWWTGEVTDAGPQHTPPSRTPRPTNRSPRTPTCSPHYATATTRRRQRHRPQPAPRPARRQPPRPHPRPLARHPRRPGLALHHTPQRRLDLQRRRTRRQTRQRHQAVSSYWQTRHTLNRWCLINSYLTPPATTASPPSTPSPAPSPANPGYPHQPRQRNHTRSHHQPVNGLRSSPHTKAQRRTERTRGVSYTITIVSSHLPKDQLNNVVFRAVAPKPKSSSATQPFSSISTLPNKRATSAGGSLKALKPRKKCFVAKGKHSHQRPLCNAPILRRQEQVHR